jgi:hypothetical protein
MSELRTKKQTDTASEPERKMGIWRGIQVAPILFCILLLTVSPVTAADAGLYEDNQTSMDTDPPPAPIAPTWSGAREGGANPENATPLSDPGEIREQHIVQYVEENRSADHGEGVRQIRASVLRQISDLETRGYDVADLRSAIESGDEEQVKNALSCIPGCATGT